MERPNRTGAERTTGQGAAAAAPAKEADQLPDQRSLTYERIAELRNRLLNGTYEVDAAKLSAKIVERHFRR